MNFDKENNQKQNKKGPLKYIGMMGACCLLPILIATVLPLVSSSLGETRFIPLITSLICPIMMIVMMFKMFKGGQGHNCCSDNKKSE